MEDRQPLLWTGLGLAAVVMVLVGAFGIRQLAVGDNPTGSAPSTPTSAAATTSATDPGTAPASTDPETLTAQAIVNSHNSRLQSFVTSRTRPEVRAAIWSLCINKRCQPQLHAAVFTDDGFATSDYLILPRSGFQVLLPAGRKQFYVSAGRNDQWLVSADGTKHAVTATERVSPLGVNEMLVPTPWADHGSYRALDPFRGVIHPIPLPRGTVSLNQAPDGRLVGVSYPRGSTSHRAIQAIWSSDGGNTWSRHPVGVAGLDLVGQIGSTGDGSMAWAQAGDGATLFGFEELIVTRDDGATWQHIVPRVHGSDGDRATMAGEIIRPNGSLLVLVNSWSDETVRKPSKHVVGFYASAGNDWSRFAPLRPALPPHAETGDLLALGVMVSWTSTTQRQQTIYAADFDSVLFVSADGARSWTRTPAR
jgi:hypothetical protein